MPRAAAHALALVAIFLSIPVLSCSKKPSWTEAEIQNANYVLAAFTEAQAATRIANTGQALMSQSDFQQMVSHVGRAYELAQKVEDRTLDKVNSELRKHWRNEFSEGLRLRLQNLSRGDVAAEIKGAALLDQFGDWWNAHKGDIHIPANGSQ